MKSILMMFVCSVLAACNVVDPEQSDETPDLGVAEAALNKDGAALLYPTYAASLAEVQGRWFRMTNSYLGPARSLDTYSTGYNDPFMGITGNYSGQYWYLTSLGGDWYRLTNMFLGVGRSLDTYFDTNMPFMGTTGYYSGQYWHLTAYGDHCFRLTNMFLGEGRSLDTYSDTCAPFMGTTGNYSGQCWRLTVL